MICTAIELLLPTQPPKLKRNNLERTGIRIARRLHRHLDAQRQPRIG
jgi:hypothetical protein